VTWRRLKSGLVAIGCDGTSYRVKIEADQFVVSVAGPSAVEVVQGPGMPWLSEAEAQAWCDEHDAWRQE